MPRKENPILKEARDFVGNGSLRQELHGKLSDEALERIISACCYVLKVWGETMTQTCRNCGHEVFVGTHTNGSYNFHVNINRLGRRTHIGRCWHRQMLPTGVISQRCGCTNPEPKEKVSQWIKNTN